MKIHGHNPKKHSPDPRPRILTGEQNQSEPLAPPNPREREAGRRGPASWFNTAAASMPGRVGRL
jgi:hypothetical protein